VGSNRLESNGGRRAPPAPLAHLGYPQNPNPNPLIPNTEPQPLCHTCYVQSASPLGLVHTHCFSQSHDHASSAPSGFCPVRDRRDGWHPGPLSASNAPTGARRSYSLLEEQSRPASADLSTARTGRGRGLTLVDGSKQKGKKNVLKRFGALCFARLGFKF
jgi:hypothetical protein